jgi:hypothetical protein
MTTPSRNGTGKHTANGTAKPSRNGVHRLNGHANGAAVSDRLTTAKNGAAEPPAQDAGDTVVAAHNDAPATPQADGGRDPASGKFTRGNPGGPGRPRNPWTRELARRRKLLLATFSEEFFCKLVHRLFEFAMAGNMAAAWLLLVYALGRPGEAPDPDGLDQDEWDRLAARPSVAEMTRVLIDGCDPAEAIPYALEQEPQGAEAFRAEQARRIATTRDNFGNNCVLVDVRTQQTARAAAAGRKR